MSIEIREATSKEMKKHKKIVEKFISNIPFDEKMEERNWNLIRKVSNMSHRITPKEKDVIFKIIEDINGIVVIPPEIENEKNIILYIHGGGFVNGSAKRTKGYCSTLAKYSKCIVITCDYSLAPEKPYPNAINDVYKTYNTILNNYKDCNISLIGDSAGANICLALTIRLINNNNKLPSSLVLNSPLVDLSYSLKRDYEINDFIVKESFINPLQKMYIKEEKNNNPEISPIHFENFNKFPPVFITCDYNETLRMDAEELYEKCINSNVEAHIIKVKNTFHSFAIMGTSTPETKQILEDICLFINDKFKK